MSCRVPSPRVPDETRQRLGRDGRDGQGHGVDLTDMALCCRRLDRGVRIKPFLPDAASSLALASAPR